MNPLCPYGRRDDGHGGAHVFAQIGDLGTSGSGRSGICQAAGASGDR